MASWSPENATKAFLRALKMGKGGKEPDVAEFISALAAGNNAQLMVMACAGVAGTTALALVAAKHQTGGRVVCILPSQNYLKESKESLRPYSNCVDFFIGNPKTLLLDNFKGADFVLIDCDIKEHRGVFLAAAQKGTSGHDGALIVGYNALGKGSWGSDSRAQIHFLPIGGGLLVSRVTSSKRSHWVVKVDKCTGEEHVFRITSPKRPWVQA
ncbi:S-adenosyl-L-methionine-dependent methyltransferase [Trema orientale]|uniref:S-adenosyl-L-methionine-dependent methyltransferase n=1 Tax=Trema orientale TaxID=63057 RepID=A0A2P5CCB8_TREOI|nr:S-adenosyl-L-methionine-dependent methyltransferase [Trema orientale]